ncbi:NAD-dependent dehydratase [Xenophilus sp. AP218F]|nr:NAD-dependent dehydratase [Xenophilus sp. AP218F]
MTSRNICLIGGSGFVGGYLAERLTRAGCRLRIATRRPERQKSRLATLPGAEMIQADVFQPAHLDRLLAGQDAVVSMVGILHGSRRQFERAHVELTDAILQACARQGVRRLVHISALGAAQDAPSDYLQTKALAELAIRASGLDWTILRPSVIFGRGDSFLTLFAQLLAALPALPLAGADSRFAPIWVEDVASAVAACLDNSACIGQSLDLAGPEVYTLAELVRLTGRLTGRPRPIIPLPAGLAMLQAALMECLPGPTLMSRDNVRSLSLDNVSDQPFPGQLLGFAPASLAAIAPSYLAGEEFNTIVSRYRSKAAR